MAINGRGMSKYVIEFNTNDGGSTMRVVSLTLVTLHFKDR